MAFEEIKEQIDHVEDGVKSYVKNSLEVMLGPELQMKQKQWDCAIIASWLTRARLRQSVARPRKSRPWGRGFRECRQTTGSSHIRH